jgi:carbonic anhydrase
LVKISANQAVSDLKAGNARFLEGHSTLSVAASLEKLREYGAKNPLPKAIVLCCSDSRAPVEMIFDQGIGDLFVIRVAGNIIAPSLVGSIEFAASTYGTELILIMGHSGCGAVDATLTHIENPQRIPSENIHDIVSRIKPHIFSIAAREELSHGERLDLAVEANVRASVGQLAHSSRIVEKMVSEGNLVIRGAVLDLLTGCVEFLED